MTANIGSVSSGTLRAEDLLEAFANELERQARLFGKPPAALVDEARGALADIDDEDDSAYSDLVQELIDALNEYSPPYCYFGAHPGDGADFGWWPDMISIEELPRVKSGDEAKARGEDCLYVNDHGNVTVFAADGRAVLECV